MTSTPYVRFSIANGVATIELARPEKQNAITIAMYHAIAGGIRTARLDAGVRAVLLTGQPGIFTAGNDLGDFLERPLAGRDTPLSNFMVEMLECPTPVVAAVTGLAVGVGVTMLLHCDLVYVSDEARLIMPFVALGLVPEFGSSLLLPRLMGHARAAEKLLLGEPLTPAEAVGCGLATAVVPAADVVAHARRAAERFNHLAPESVQETKRLMRAPLGARVRETAETESRILAARLASPEAKQVIRAILDKSPSAERRVPSA